MKILGRPKLKERERAIHLRRQGLTYSEILRKVPVSKSTLSVWLGDVGLTSKQTQRITEKKKAAMLRGSESVRRNRIERTLIVHKLAQKEFSLFNEDPLFLLGIALYWAEGSKQKESNVSQSVSFSNMDVRTHQIMLLWVEKYLGRKKEDLVYQLYIHNSGNVSKAKSFWKTHLAVPAGIIRIYFKPSNLRTIRQSTDTTYNGVLRFVVPMSTDLNRKISAWVDNVVQYVH